MAPTAIDLQKALGDYVTLRQAEIVLVKHDAPITSVTLKRYAEAGRIRHIHDPLGRMLLLRSDVEKLAAERSGTAKAS
jgi:predicted site-specific integrase-resolvase